MSTPTRKADTHAFLVIPENRLAFTACESMLPRAESITDQPLTVFGGAGLGKSHLARQLVRRWTTLDPDSKVIHLTATEFAAALAEASASKTIPQFQDRHRRDVQLFVCEDIQFLGERRETTQQLVAAVDEILRTGGRVMLTSSRPPGEVPGLARRLVNRIHGGISVEITRPEVESRERLLTHFAESLQMIVDDEIISLLATEYDATPRELYAVMLQIRSTRRQIMRRNGGLHREEICRLLEELSQRPPLTITAICRAVARYYGVRLSELRGPRRSQGITLPRHAAMFLTRELTGLQYAEIGEYFSGRNHSTVMHACHKIERLLVDSPQVATQVYSLRESLKL